MSNDKAPDAFRTISEAAEDLGLEQHVLRFWETRFSQIKPLKRGGGRRYYRPDDVDFLRGLRHLLHDQRYTIKGVQKIIKDQGAKSVAAIGRGQALAPPPAANAIAGVAPAPMKPAAQGSRRDQLEAALAELLAAKQALAAA
jgi:DNA-binding transcriptional MerR regulator